MYYTYFRFRRSERRRVSEIIGRNRESPSHNRYKCDRFTAACVLLKLLGAPTRLKEAEEFVGMYSPKLS